METKPATFTLEVKGLQLPDEVREEISQALNATLMRKLGEMDLRTRNAAAPNAISTGNLFGKVVRINGGEITKLIHAKDFGATFNQSLGNKLVLEAGIERVTGQLQ